MSSRTVFLARLSGLFLVLMSLSLMANKAATLEAVTAVVHQPSLLLMFGMIGLPAGLAMVIAHNIWSGGATPVVVTILGWLLLAKSLICLIVPEGAMIRLYELVRFPDFFYGFIGVYLLIGFYLAYSSLHPSPAAKSVAAH